MQINPTRLQFARVRRGLSQTALANKLSVSARSVRGYESGEYDPDNLKLLSETLGFPEHFFYGDDLPIISEHAVSFRSMSKMSITLKNVALSSGVIAFLLNEWLESEFNLPRPNIPDLSDLGPEEAAIALRRLWGLGNAPIPNMISLLEKNGIRVFSLAIDAKEVDAFSVWKGDTPFVFLNTMKSSERSRFDAAHELGHLVRDLYSMKHSIERENPREVENQANEFASSFLMPKEDVISASPKFVTIESLIALKKRWGVSVAALAYRMFKLGMVSEWVYTRHLTKEISRKGFRTSEPSPIAREESSLLKNIISLLQEDCITIDDIANQIMVNPQDLRNLAFGLDRIPLRVLKGGNNASTRIHLSETPHLRLVK